MAVVVGHLATLDNALARALVWAAAWDMVRDAELPARDYVALVVGALPVETDINLVTSTLGQARGAVTFYADPAWAATGWAQLADAARETLTTSKPGTGFQLAWARAYLSAISEPADLDTVAGWLDGENVPPGLAIDTEMRWNVLHVLVSSGRAGEPEISRELDRDRTASGEIAAATASALLPTPEGKEEAWRRITAEEAPPNWLQRALLDGFQHHRQLELTAPYTSRFFEVLDRIWATRDSEPAQEFVEAAYPLNHVSQETVDASEAWLTDTGRPWAMRRLVAEGKDGVVRAMAGRARDASSGSGA